MRTTAVPRWRIFLTGAALLALAVIGLGVAHAGSSAPTRSSDPATADVAQALLAGPSADGATAGDAALLRPRRLGRALVHGTITLNLPQKGLLTVQLDHGTVAAIGAGSVTISEAGNASVTVATGDTTRVRKNGQKATLSDLKRGDDVFVVSEIEGGKAIAYRIVVPKAPAQQ